MQGVAGQQQVGQRVDLRLAIWLAQRPVPAGGLSRRLGEWLDWTDAVTLAQRVNAPFALEADAAPAESLRDWAHAALDRLQAELRAGFDDPLLARDAAQPAPVLDFADLMAPYRLHHSQQQRAIAARCASLRERLRERLLASGASRLQQLALLDHALDRALDERLRRQLAALPEQLSQRAERLHAAHPPTCRAAIWQQFQHALSLELDLRLQPLLGLVDALNETP